MVPNKDFKVVYYDRYTGLSISKVFTEQAVSYLLGTQLSDFAFRYYKNYLEAGKPYFIINSGKNAWNWFAKKEDEMATRTVLAADLKTLDNLSDVLKGHEAAFQIIIDSLSSTEPKKSNEFDVVYENKDENFKILHTMNYLVFRNEIGARSWFPNHSDWDFAMSECKNKMFIFHMTISEKLYKFVYFWDLGKCYDDVNRKTSFLFSVEQEDAVTKFIEEKLS
ncbi:MAG TPA: hypothetical protein VJ201_04445 [Candidatus Babeliales bacterium]|nr:hypothetical protein [Candidatus Babeliales bacterium]